MPRDDATGDHTQCDDPRTLNEVFYRSVVSLFILSQSRDTAVQVPFETPQAILTLLIRRLGARCFLRISSPNKFLKNRIEIGAEHIHHGLNRRLYEFSSTVIGVCVE